jgi:hypothetical protein
VDEDEEDEYEVFVSIILLISIGVLVLPVPQSSLPVSLQDVDDEERPKTEMELHYSEPWFHGRLVGDRATAEHALKDFRNVEGKRLVKDCCRLCGD